MTHDAWSMTRSKKSSGRSEQSARLDGGSSSSRLRRSDKLRGVALGQSDAVVPWLRLMMSSPANMGENIVCPPSPRIPLPPGQEPVGQRAVVMETKDKQQGAVEGQRTGQSAVTATGTNRRRQVLIWASKLCGGRRVFIYESGSAPSLPVCGAQQVNFRILALQLFW